MTHQSGPWPCARHKPSEANAAKALAKLISSGQSIVILGIILQEILQGIRNQQQFTKLQSVLAAFPLIEPTRPTYEYAAELFSACRRKGIQVGTIDCLIASAAIKNDWDLLTTDQDFHRLAQMAPLRLFTLVD